MKCDCGYEGDPEFGDFKDSNKNFDEYEKWLKRIGNGCEHMRAPPMIGIPALLPLCDLTKDSCRIEVCPEANEPSESPLKTPLYEKPSFPNSHIRCPKCKSTEHILIETWEHVKKAILYPEYCVGSPDWTPALGKHIKTRKAITFLNAKDTNLGSYSIYCPVCEWGEGGGLEQEKVDELRKLYAETVKTP
jgi:hypothetical protein